MDKKIRYIKSVFCVVLAWIFLFMSCAINAASVQAAEDVKTDHVIAYYFHGDFRCASCHKIENYTEEAIKEYFGEQLGSGQLVYKVVNVEQGENAHFVEDYGLYTKSVVLSLIQDGKEVTYENLTKVWEYLGNKQNFFDYIRTETDKFLGKLKE